MSGEPTLRLLDFSNKHDYDSAIDVMVQSFAFLPTWSYLYRPGDTSAAEARVKYYLHAVAELGEIWAFEHVSPGSGSVMQSVIGFTPPGKIYSDASTVVRDQRAVDEALGDSFKPSPSFPSILEWAPEGFDAEAALASSWKITLLGTIPSAAGQGFGSKMSQLVVDRAAQHGEGAWVWTTYEPRLTKQIRFYERLGFQRVQISRTVNALGEAAMEYALYKRPSLAQPSSEAQDASRET